MVHSYYSTTPNYLLSHSTLSTEVYVGAFIYSSDTLLPTEPYCTCRIEISLTVMLIIAMIVLSCYPDVESLIGLCNGIRISFWDFNCFLL